MLCRFATSIDLFMRNRAHVCPVTLFYLFPFLGHLIFIGLLFFHYTFLKFTHIFLKILSILFIYFLKTFYHLERIGISLLAYTCNSWNFSTRLSKSIPTASASASSVRALLVYPKEVAANGLLVFPLATSEYSVCI